jgi:hypothetical protein
VLANRQRHAWLELANQITDVRALSETQLQITLKSAYPFLQELALPRSALSPRRSLSKEPARHQRRSAPARGC